MSRRLAYGRARTGTAGFVAGALLLIACSPEARRERDGGPGADPGNKRLITVQEPVPIAEDTTLWPGRAPTTVERLSAGERPPPATAATAPVATPGVTPATPPTRAQERTFSKGTAADPRAPSSAARPGRDSTPRSSP